MILVNTFEDPFGDEFGQGVWKELDGTVSSNIQANTVALASFDGKVVTLCRCLIFVLLPLFICLYA